MKKIFIFFILIFYSIAFSDTERKTLYLVEEGLDFWDNLLNEKSINNKNLLYASYVAYKDRLNELSIETFQECKANNSSSPLIIGISEYYIGKNLFYIGRYKEAIEQFVIVNGLDLVKYNNYKPAVTINIAISYYQLGDDEKFKENLQKVINNSEAGIYKRKAEDILSLVQ